MKIDIIKTGFLKENCYVLSKGNNCLVIDPGDDYELIKEIIKNKKVLAVLITHYHFDHIGCLNDLLNDYNTSVIDYKNIGINKIGDFIFDVIETKGHKEDSVTYYFKEEKIMFTGDFLFKESIGRCDLEGGNESDMKKSILKIITYPKDIKIYPGHGEDTTLENEIKNNIFLGGYYE